MPADQKILFHSTIFGPVHSRRLGTSLGINLSPNDGKICSFDCIYCEAGYNRQGAGTTGFPSRESVRTELKNKLQQMKDEGSGLDVITFSGNGEPTLHPDFAGIVEDTIALRDSFYPEAKVSVLSNSTRLGNKDVDKALRKVDNNILKLDSAIEETMRLIDCPNQSGFTVEKVLKDLEKFGKECIIQTMMLRGTHDGQPVDNTTDAEINALAEAYRRINPEYVMLYSLDRSTPEENLQKVERPELETIARRLQSLSGVTVNVS